MTQSKKQFKERTALSRQRVKKSKDGQYIIVENIETFIYPHSYFVKVVAGNPKQNMENDLDSFFPED